MKNFSFFTMMFVLAMMFLTSCIGGDRPTVCDDIQEPSILCDMAQKHDMRLEDIGTAFIIVNSVAISKGVYTKHDAKGVIEKLIQSLDGSVTYAFFKETLVEYTSSYPGLLEVAKVYLDEFSLAKRMYPTDRDLLRGWLDDRLMML